MVPTEVLRINACLLILAHYCTLRGNATTAMCWGLCKDYYPLKWEIGNCAEWGRTPDASRSNLATETFAWQDWSRYLVWLVPRLHCLFPAPATGWSTPTRRQPRLFCIPHPPPSHKETHHYGTYMVNHIYILFGVPCRSFLLLHIW